VPWEGGLGGEGWRRPNTLQGASALGARIENQGLRAELRWDKLGKYARYTRQEESASLPRESGEGGGRRRESWLSFRSFARSRELRACSGSGEVPERFEYSAPRQERRTVH